MLKLTSKRYLKHITQNIYFKRSFNLSSVILSQQNQDATKSSSAAAAAAATATDQSFIKTSSTSDGKIKTHFVRDKKLKELLLVKNFFSGKVDTDMLTYPEVIPRDLMTDLLDDIERASEYFQQQNVNSEEINATKKIPDNVIAGIKQLNMFGVDIPVEWEGGNYGATQLSYYNETEARDVNIAVTLNAHRLATRIISECGSEVQKRNYLPRLAKGELIGAIAFYEATSPQNGGIFNTKSKLNNEENAWIISGQKSFVTNATNANLFIVFAQTKSEDKLGDLKDTVSVFLVEKNQPGFMVIGDRDITIGCKGVPQSAVTFDQVEVKLENIVGELGNGTEIAQTLLRYARLQSGVISLVLMKKIINELTKYCMETNQYGVQLTDMELLRDKLARATTATYALESMLYLTAGIIDDYAKPDIDLESCIIRIFAKQNLLKTASIALDFMGPKTMVTGQTTDLNLRNSLHLYTHAEPMDSLKLFVGLTGVQHAGHSLHEVVKKVRNPAMNPTFIFKRLFEAQSIESPKTSLNLNHYLHPSLDPAAQWLEHSIVRLHTSTETILSRYGAQVIDKQVEILRLAECAVLCFAMYASVARSSRAYCIGLQFADYEMLIANAFCADSTKHIREIAIDIRDGPYSSSDVHYQKISNQIFKSKGYFPVHPLTRNF